MGLWQGVKSLFSRKKTVPPEGYAFTAMALADAHFEQLQKRVADVAPATWRAIHGELYRAYFSMASLAAGERLSDSDMNRFGGRMLKALTASPEATPEIVAAMSDTKQFEYSIVAYCHGEPSAEDAAEAAEWRKFLRVPSDAGITLAICSLLHTRISRHLGIKRSDARAIDVWLVNGTFPPGAIKEVLGSVEPAL